jgi:hypothetical protein
MKKYLIFILFVLPFTNCIVSCDGYLDPEVMTDLTVDQATTEYTYSRQRVASIYSDIIAGFLNIDGAMLASASDEAEHTLETCNVHHFNRGSWNEYRNPDNVWSTYYRSIRKINQFIVSCDNINLDQYKNNPSQQETYQNYLQEIDRWKYEVRFLRAYFYFELIKRYGGVPLLTNFYSIDDDFSGIPRNSLADCITFIVNECDITSKVLPVRYAAGELGRVTSIAALALKSRVLLYAASELFNNSNWTSGYSNPELIALSGDRLEKWQAAADAAKEAIDLAESNGYTLSSSYSNIFGVNAHSNSEVFFCRRQPYNSNDFEKANISVGFDLGNSGTTPTQNLVDTYEMSDGSKFDWNNPEHSANPYQNRDPRLVMTIVTNNSTYKGRPMESWDGGRDGAPIAHASKTGYYLRKYVNEDLNLVTNQTSAHSWVIFRLTELYLNYVEALNEIDPGNQEIKSYFDKVRQRGGVNMPELPSGLNQSETRERIYNERCVEFAFEDHRLWDVRRWMTATTVLSSPVKGVKVTKISDSQFNYSVIDVEGRTFSPKMYFYPIPQNEIHIDNGLIQNPLW